LLRQQLAGQAEKKTLAMDNETGRPFTIKFLEGNGRTTLELVNVSDQALKSVEILTVFLKDEDTPGGGPSQAHIKFETVKSIQASQNIALLHRTWINGKPVQDEQDQLDRLRVIDGRPRPYVLDISWQDDDGKTRFQRIPVGH
jgi:hypothetical protein